MNNRRFIPVLVALVITLVIAFVVPVAKYAGPDIISRLNIPFVMSEWRGYDVSRRLNINDERYKFISKAFARIYRNRYGEELLFLMLDAGNFHHPKVCFGSAGSTIRELPDKVFTVKNRTFKAHALYTEKGGDGLLVIYWICIDKQLTDWTGQKIKQLWYSMFNKKRVGLMVRLDIPSKQERISDSLKLADDFVVQLADSLPQGDWEYIAGKN